MTRSELELAHRHLNLTQKMYDSKKMEFQQAKVLMERLQEQMVEAELDVNNAKKLLSLIEYRMQVVVIDCDCECDNHHHHGPQKSKQPALQRDALNGAQITLSHLDTIIEKDRMYDQSLPSNPNRADEDSTTSQSMLLPLPPGLRRSLKRHRRKLARRNEEG